LAKSGSSSSASSPSLLTYAVVSDASKEEGVVPSSLRLETAFASLALQEEGVVPSSFRLETAFASLALQEEGEEAERTVGIVKAVNTDGE
jgi:hypothetical protein